MARARRRLSRYRFAAMAARRVRMVSMAAEYPVRPIAAAEFPAFYAVAEHAFNSAAPSEPSRQHEFATFEAGRSLAAFDQASMVATASAYSFTMAVPGALTEVAGVTAVAVLPSHRRRGILSGLMRRQLADLRDNGEAVAALFASESGIYGRYGYGAASAQLRFTIRRGEAQLTRPQDAWSGTPAAQGLRLRIADAQRPRAELAGVYEAMLPTRPGMYARDDRWWESLLADPEHNRRGASPLRCVLAEDDTGPRGYALYNVQPEWGDDGIPAGVLNIRELLADGPEAFAVIWGDLLTRDLVGEVRARQRPVDDPLLHLLADRRRARAQLTDGLWVRLVDVRRALSQRRYACPVDLVIEVTDDLLTSNAGRWRLQAGGPASPACCERTTAPADVALPVQALGATYLGGTRLGALAAAGLAAERRAGALAGLSTALAWDPAPWCPTIF
jgi:predicted acetyltransferase